VLTTEAAAVQLSSAQLTLSPSNIESEDGCAIKPNSGEPLPRPHHRPLHPISLALALALSPSHPTPPPKQVHLSYHCTDVSPHYEPPRVVVAPSHRERGSHPTHPEITPNDLSARIMRASLCYRLPSHPV
jgi:hypothetical protein